ncbi:hypothetical protein TNCT_737111 [Trichonephila clavata]|uniref:Uncharacterized protein n=1 Tax=Trichonephila clavata TaxID=2740835 RepID=A0A8X6LUN8_TRICU|nr:hypothetical protein TNCT_737111 [Trichonephila clavata]
MGGPLARIPPRQGWPAVTAMWRGVEVKLNTKIHTRTYVVMYNAKQFTASASQAGGLQPNDRIPVQATVRLQYHSIPFSIPLLHALIMAQT